MSDSAVAITKLTQILKQFDPKNGFDQPWEDKIVDELYLYRHQDLGTLGMEIIQAIGKHDGLWYPGGTAPTDRVELMDWSGKSFMEIFTRNILPEKLRGLKEECMVNNKKFAQAAECWVEGFGPVENLYSDRLKKSVEDCKKDMENMGCNLEGYSYINCRLLLSYYHMIHSPVNGVVKRILPCPQESNFFGDNALWLVEIETDTDPVYMLIVGELNVQDFDFSIKEGQDISILDKIGHFGWGSQMLYFLKVPSGQKLALTENVAHYFVGDDILSTVLL